MGLRCSILGHTFDETEVRRDRRERGSGNEVVTVVSQVERCSRCGTERVVSENKEVVSVVDADEVGLDEGTVEGERAPGAAGSTRDESRGSEHPEGGLGDDADRPGGRPEGEASGAGADPGSEPGTDSGRSSVESDAGSSPSDEPAGAPGGVPGSGGSADPADEDVEFITETEGSLGGGEDVAGDADVPAEAGDGEGGIGGMADRSGAYDGSGSDNRPGEPDPDGAAGEDAEILDAPEAERAPGQWPDGPEGEEPWEPDPLEEGSESPSEPTADPAPDVEPVAEPSFTVPDGSLKCPTCGHEVSADSSFRAGDACPECQGYLENAGE